MFLCCQLNAFSVRLGLELGLGERPPLLCFQEGRSVVGCIAVCTHWTLDPILGLWPPQVWSQGPPPTLHCEAPLKLGHWDHHQPTSRVRFEKMSSILKWYLSDGAVWAAQPSLARVVMSAVWAQHNIDILTSPTGASAGTYNMCRHNSTLCVFTINVSPNPNQ